MDSSQRLAPFISTSLRRLWPAPIVTTPTERLRSVAGAALGILVTGLLCRWLIQDASPWLIAPIGASAVLVFAAPFSPLAQPWSVVGGNTVSALIGTACAVLVPDTALAAALAVSLAIGAMILLRCLHPPGGATALLVVLTHSTTLSFVAFPVFTNSLLLVLVGIAYNSLIGRSYPHIQVAPSAPVEPPGATRFTKADLDAALVHYNQFLDVSPADLGDLLGHAEAAAYQRTLGELRCQDIMTPKPLVVEFGTALHEAWALMRQSGVKALPVVDNAHRVAGIVTVADFLRHARLDEYSGLASRLQGMLRPSGLTHTDRPEVVGQIMTRQVRVASASRHALELIPLFSAAGHHHLPIIDEDKRLVGILTQTDLVRALSKAVKP
jgi:CBS domain-containing membrane protein